MESLQDIFGEVISSYSRAQAIEDGVLHALPANLVKEAGIKFPVAVSAKVQAECIDLSPAAERACNDITGRTWDILRMFSVAAKQARGTHFTFQLYVVRNRVRPTLTTLKAICGPGDDMEPVITIMMEDED